MTPTPDALLDWYRSLSPQTLDQVTQLYTPDATFQDPFNTVQGSAAIRQIFAHMFQATESPRFVIDECVQQGRIAYVRWNFHFILRRKPYCIHGISRLTLAEDGRVQAHRDYWDSAAELYRKLPWIGALVARLSRLFQAPTLSDAKNYN